MRASRDETELQERERKSEGTTAENDWGGGPADWDGWGIGGGERRRWLRLVRLVGEDGAEPQ